MLPSLEYLHAVNQQCHQKCWEWTPWKKILSEEQLVRLKVNRGGMPIWCICLPMPPVSSQKDWILTLVPPPSGCICFCLCVPTLMPCVAAGAWHCGMRTQTLSVTLLICVPKPIKAPKPVLKKEGADPNRWKRKLNDTEVKDKRRKDDCFAFLDGRCARGTNCRFNHPADLKHE